MKIIKNFIGQSHILADVSIQIQASLQEGVLPDPICIHGPKGMGKTKLAKSIYETLKLTTQKPFRYEERTGDYFDRESYDSFLGLTYGITPKVIFIDELQGMSPYIQNHQLRYFMDEKIINGERLGEICWIFATTDWGQIVDPLRSRITNVYYLKDYSLAEMMAIARLIGNDLEIENDTAKLIAESARFCPRDVENFIKKLRKEISITNKLLCEVAQGICSRLDIFHKGLNGVEIDILKILCSETGTRANEAIRKRGISKSRLISCVNINKLDFETIYERYLIRLGFIESNSSGRKITLKGEEYLYEYIFK